MSTNIIIVTGLFYLIPGNAELCYRNTLASGNMGLNGVYLDVINKRNFLYICGLSSIFLLFMPFKMLGSFMYCLFIFSVLAYFRSIKTWHVYLY